MEAIQHFILEFAIVPVIGAALTGLLRYRKLVLMQRYLLLLTLLALLVEVVSRTLMYYKRPNLFLAPIDTVLEFVLLAFIYRHELRPGVISRIIPVLLLGFVLGSAMTYSPRLDTRQFSPVQHFTESVLVLGFVVAYFQREITRQSFSRRLEREPMFWVSTGLLLYFLSSMFIFLSSNYTLSLSTDLSRNVWAVHALLYIFLNTLYAVALWLPGQRHTIVT